MPIKEMPQGAWPAGGHLRSSGRDMGEFVAANLGERVDHPLITKAMHLAQKALTETWRPSRLPERLLQFVPGSMMLIQNGQCGCLVG